MYWILMFLWLIFGLWTCWPLQGASLHWAGGMFLQFILFALLGWKVMGPPIKKD